MSDYWIAEDMEEAADAANADATPIDWEQLGAIEREALALAAGGRLNNDVVSGLLRRARAAVPRSRRDVLTDLERDLWRLLGGERDGVS